MPSRRFTGGGSKVPSKRTMVKKKGMAHKPDYPAGNPGMIQGVTMLKQRKPR